MGNRATATSFCFERQERHRMSTLSTTDRPSGPNVPRDDEGGLRPPPGLSFWRRVWWWFDFLILVKLARLRFVAILLVIGLIITQWDTLIAYYEKWTRPAGAAAVSGSAFEWFCPMHPSVVRDNPKDKIGRASCRERV